MIQGLTAERRPIALPAGMALIPSGEFLMGSSDADPDAGRYEKPVHNVWLDSFAMDEAPVTNEQFAAFVAAAGYITTAERVANASCGEEVKTWRHYADPSREHHPVVCVSWDDAAAYCVWRADVTGSPFRLPSEAEWEKAARGGLEQELFPWGSDDPDGKACWNRAHLLSGTLPARSFAPNGYGLYNAAGNVWEWCSDWYCDDYYRQCHLLGVVHNPQGPEDGARKVRRGASFNVREAFRMRCANRGAVPPSESWPNVGFRCALSLVDYTRTDKE